MSGGTRRTRGRGKQRRGLFTFQSTDAFLSRSAANRLRSVRTSYRMLRVMERTSADYKRLLLSRAPTRSHARAQPRLAPETRSARAPKLDPNHA
jgi:hypothetical protein